VLTSRSVKCSLRAPHFRSCRQTIRPPSPSYLSQPRRLPRWRPGRTRGARPGRCIGASCPPFLELAEGAQAGKRHLRIRARSAAGKVAGAAMYQLGLAAHQTIAGLPNLHCSRMPLSRTVAPYSPARRRPPAADPWAQAASTALHTSYQPDLESMIAICRDRAANARALAGRSDGAALDRRRDGRGSHPVPPRQRLPPPASAPQRAGGHQYCPTRQGGCRLITHGPATKAPPGPGTPLLTRRGPPTAATGPCSPQKGVAQ
jgi:hypothetical protein